MTRCNAAAAGISAGNRHARLRLPAGGGDSFGVRAGAKNTWPRAACRIASQAPPRFCSASGRENPSWRSPMNATFQLRPRPLPAITASAINHDGSTCSDIDRHMKRALHAGSSLYRLDEPLLASLAPSLIVTQELCEVGAVSFRQVARAARRLPGDISVLALERAIGWAHR